MSVFENLDPFWVGFLTALACVVGAAALLVAGMAAYLGLRYLAVWRNRGAWSDK